MILSKKPASSGDLTAVPTFTGKQTASQSISLVFLKTKKKGRIHYTQLIITEVK